MQAKEWIPNRFITKDEAEESIKEQPVRRHQTHHEHDGIRSNNQSEILEHC